MSDPGQQHEEMRQILSRWVEIPDELWGSFAAIFKLRRVREKDHIIRPHDVFDEIFFVNGGLLRIYYLSADGKEFNKSFISEGMFAGSFVSYNGISEISCGVQALEDSVLLAAEYRHFAAFYDRHQIFDRPGRMALEWLLVRKEQREQSFLLSSAKERFQDFARQHPELVRRVPQYHLASYLGITEVSLSRLKRELS